MVCTTTSVASIVACSMLRGVACIPAHVPSSTRPSALAALAASATHVGSWRRMMAYMP
jgi:hypothetical protein